MGVPYTSKGTEKSKEKHWQGKRENFKSKIASPITCYSSSALQLFSKEKKERGRYLLLKILFTNTSQISYTSIGTGEKSKESKERGEKLKLKCQCSNNINCFSKGKKAKKSKERMEKIKLKLSVFRVFQ